MAKPKREIIQLAGVGPAYLLDEVTILDKATGAVYSTWTRYQLLYVPGIVARRKEAA